MFNNIKSLPHIGDLQTKASQDQHLKYKEIVELRKIFCYLNFSLVTVRLLTERKLIIAVCYKKLKI